MNKAVKKRVTPLKFIQSLGASFMSLIKLSLSSNSTRSAPPTLDFFKSWRWSINCRKKPLYQLQLVNTWKVSSCWSDLKSWFFIFFLTKGDDMALARKSFIHSTCKRMFEVFVSIFYIWQRLHSRKLSFWPSASLYKNNPENCLVYLFFQLFVTRTDLFSVTLFKELYVFCWKSMLE